MYINRYPDKTESNIQERNVLDDFDQEDSLDASLAVNKNTVTIYLK